MTFALLGLFIFVWRYQSIPEPKKEEETSSREFWMFVGSLVLLFSSVLINGASSLPVYNKLMRYLDPSFVGNVLKDPIDHYNKYQLWIAVFIGLLSASGIWLQWRTTASKLSQFWVKIAIHLGFACLLTWLTTYWINLPSYQHIIMAITSWFTVSSNLHYLSSKFRHDAKGVASSTAHMGFGLMSIGILATGLNYKHLNNPFMFKEIFEAGDEEKYVQLIKGSPLMLKDYLVTYESDTLIDKARFYDISFKQMDKDLVTVKYSFKTRPNAVYSNDFTKIAAFNPDTRHYAHKDIFTCVVQLPPAIMDVELAKQIEDTTKYISYNSVVGDTIMLPSQDKLVITQIETNPTNEEYGKHDHDIGFGLKYFVLDEFGREHTGAAAIGLDGNVMYKYPGVLEKLGVRIRPSESFLEQLVTPEDKLNYTTFKVKQGEPFLYQGHEVILATFDKNIDSSKYEVKDGDIAVAGVLQITKDKTIKVAKPLFVIRGSSPFGIKDYTPDFGIHSRLTNIDPRNNEFEIKLAIDKRSTSNVVPVEVATNVPRNDYIILEAKIFPGINIFWIGASLMMIGLLISWGIRWKKQ
jgi:cytochrome c-type biogenesis protein CcmF